MLSAPEIAGVVAELAPRLQGGAFGRAFQPDPATLVLELGRERLLLSVHPRLSRLHLERQRLRSGAPPPGFSQLLRRRLGGLRLAELTAPPGERVVILGFGAGRERLFAELSGPHANLFLVAADGRLVASLRPTRSTTRPLAPGDLYSPPPPAPATARWRQGDRFGPAPGIEERVAAHYDGELVRLEVSELRDRAGVALRRALARVARRLEAIHGDRAKARDAAHLRKLADLLLAHAAASPRGVARVVVPDDFEDGTPLSIALDPALDGKANAARLYRQHRRLVDGLGHIEARLAAAAAERDVLEARLTALSTLGLQELRLLAPAPRRPRAAPAERLPYREYVSLAGDRIWVGRGAADNDALTFRHACGGDLWLHTRDAPGAHVVVPLRGRPVLEATLLDAATLAAHFSPLTGEAQVDVTYTRVKHLRKPRGAAPGLVFVADAKTVRVRVQPERIARLLEPPADPLLDAP